MIRVLLMMAVMISVSGCAGFGHKLKSFLAGGDTETSESAKPAMGRPLGQSYQSNSNYMPGPQRQYKRVTKKSLQEESNIGSRAGSLWVMEGQGAFLFSQNIMRMIGDSIRVKLDGEPHRQLESKAKVVAKLLARLEERRAALRQPAAAPGKPSPSEKPSADGKAEKTAATNPAAAQNKNQEPDLKDVFPVNTVPSRVVERMVDGNYRVKGSQTFMIGSREYKVIVTGVVPAEDFSEDGINSTKLLDSKFDIVSSRRKGSTM